MTGLEWKIPLGTLAGGGALFFLSFVFGNWGPCGPNATGGVLLLMALASVPVAILSWVISRGASRILARRMGKNVPIVARGFEVMPVSSAPSSNVSKADESV